MTEIDALKYELKQERQAFNKLHKRYLELLNQQGELKKENKELKEKLERKQRRIDAYEDYIQTLKEDGVLDDD